MSMKLAVHVLVLAASVAPVVCAHADNADTANKSNNPLNLAPGANLQDYYTPKLFDSNAHIGPQITAPTADQDELGTGKWQAGLAAIAIDSSPRGLLGALVQYQSSFAGDHDRAHVETTTLQPVIIHNLEKGWYLRSTGTWTFDLKNNPHYIPLGLGGGKVWKSGSNILNAFIEPQWTVERKGGGLPKFTLFTGTNVTFGN
ncbi:hypothetical protein [Pseudomonas sp. ANT_H12B]|uniref:hypothetical protein n=1 Tax=Pseudomonas sp. ANT_H12B TaxID=2597348 RepID=UPI0011EFBDE4|nr:hypothetical protein [Pseudomonas sp. ANT_H12B]KAA0980118.1 hypothetical protein FQ185_00525 [Pseudomonas sp. ANT_H12B]